MNRKVCMTLFVKAGWKWFAGAGGDSTSSILRPTRLFPQLRVGDVEPHCFVTETKKYIAVAWGETEDFMDLSTAKSG